MIAHVVIGCQVDVFINYAAILIGAAAATLLIYEYLIRRFNPIRFLFGTKAVLVSV